MYPYIGPVDEKIQLVGSNIDKYFLLLDLQEPQRYKPVRFTPNLKGKIDVHIPRYG